MRDGVRRVANESTNNNNIDRVARLLHECNAMRAIINEHLTRAREEQQRNAVTELPTSSQLLKKKLTLTPVLTQAHDRMMRRSAASATDDTGALFDANVRRRSSPVEGGSAQLGTMVCFCSIESYANAPLGAPMGFGDCRIGLHRRR